MKLLLISGGLTNDPKLTGILVAKPGTRLSIMPVAPFHFAKNYGIG